MSSSHPLRAVSIRRDRASSPSAASQIHTGGFLGRLHRMGKTSLKNLRRSARQTGAMAKPPANGAERPCRARQTCRWCRYSGKGEREARGHLPPPQRGSCWALDALGLRRGMGGLQSQPGRKILLAGKKSLHCACFLPCLRGLRDHGNSLGRRVVTAYGFILAPFVKNSYLPGGGRMPGASIRKDRGLCASKSNTSPRPPPSTLHCRPLVGQHRLRPL